MQSAYNLKIRPAETDSTQYLKSLLCTRCRPIGADLQAEITVQKELTQTKGLE